MNFEMAIPPFVSLLITTYFFLLENKNGQNIA